MPAAAVIGPERRRDPQPLSRGWELATLLAVAAALAVAVAALTGYGVASAVWGHGWIWPRSTASATHLLGGLLHGRPDRGLRASQARLLASPVAVYACVATAEVALLGCAGAIVALVARYRRPTDARRGMATRREAAGALGLRPLRRARAIIRPDRYGAPPSARRPLDRRAVHRFGARAGVIHSPGVPRPGAAPVDEAGPDAGHRRLVPSPSRSPR